jgi:hypothetical protein
MRVLERGIAWGQRLDLARGVLAGTVALRQKSFESAGGVGPRVKLSNSH